MVSTSGNDENEKATTDQKYIAVFKKQKGVLSAGDIDALTFKSSESDLRIPWDEIEKHQVSPASHPKSLLKVVLRGQDKNPSLTFTLGSRSELERIRKDISHRLTGLKTHTAGIKRNVSGEPVLVKEDKDCTFTAVPQETLAMTRATLLANDGTLRAQHKLLVKESQTLTEEDFWMAHSDQLAEECARMYGKYRTGIKTYMASNLQLQGKVRLGVEEMRQIFILYPAVHKAYVEKVPLELSEEQFWKKYLESEYFYRDRGKIGQMTQNLKIFEPPKISSFAPADTGEDEDANVNKDKSEKDKDEKKQSQQGGAVVAGADDIFFSL